GVGAGALEPRARLELAEPQLVGQLSEDAPERPEQLDQPRWAVDGQFELAPAEGKRFQHPRQAEVVVGVVVRQEDLAELDQPNGRTQHLPLRPLGAVEEQPLPAAAQEQGSRCSLCGRHRAGGAEEHKAELRDDTCRLAWNGRIGCDAGWRPSWLCHSGRLNPAKGSTTMAPTNPAHGEVPPAVASDQAREQLRREVDPRLYDEIRQL